MINGEKISPRINYLGKFRGFSGWVWDMRRKSFPDFDLWFVFNGRGRMTIDGKTEAVGVGDCYLLRPGMNFYADNDPDAPLHTFYTHFDFVDPDGRVVNPERASALPLHQKMSDPTFFVGLSRRALDCHFGGDAATANGWLSAALLEMAREGQVATMDLSSYQAAYFRDLRSEISEQPEKKRSLRKIASRAGYSPEHFSRLFKAYGGVSFREFVSAARVNRAKLLLSSTDYPMARVAEICGFADMYLFSKQFKAAVKISPSKYRALRLS